MTLVASPTPISASIGSIPIENEVTPPIKVGISSCLMGDEVRFNGGHKRSRFCTDVLSQYFSFVPICPEVAIGMGIPRPAIRLVSDSSHEDSPVYARGVDDPSLDVTNDLRTYGEQQAELHSDLCGYVFMQKSPSCGLFDVKRYLANGHPEGTRRGIYAEAFCNAHPLLPIEEAGRLNDDGLCENFLVRVYTYHDWQAFSRQHYSAKDLLSFHARYKYLVMAHSIQHYKAIGKLLSDLKSTDLTSIGQTYFELLMTALAKPATRKMHTNTLMHLQGHLKRHVSSQDKSELTDIIDQYRRGIIPLVVPLTLLKHHLNHVEDDYAHQQVYLNPHPYELGLRNRL